VDINYDMNTMEEIINLLKSNWGVQIKAEYDKGNVCSERHLQAMLFGLLYTTFKDSDYVVWVEPTLDGEKGAPLKGLIPDLIITKENNIIAVIELKYVPHGFAKFKRDIEKLVEMDCEAGLSVPLKVIPSSGLWEKDNMFTFSKSTLYVFGVISKKGAEALSLEYIEKPINFLLLTGEVSGAESGIRMTSKEEIEKPNLSCPSCAYVAFSGCMLGDYGYCNPAVCKKCKNVYDVNTEFCGEPEEVNACSHCGAHDYKDWDQKKRPCPKCGVKMDVLNQILKS
jgi:hypothetical protein